MFKKKIMTGFVIFMGAMWLCTVISKSYYTTKLPVVSTVSPEEKYIEHIVEADGIVVEGGRQAVNAPLGLRVKEVSVQAGDKVEEGDELFRIDLEDLKEIMAEKQSQISKLQLQINAVLENEEIARQKKELDEKRAREDYDAAARQKDTEVGRAAEQYAQAMEDLEDAIYGDTDGLSDEEIEERMNGLGEEEREQLKDALQNAAYAEADAKRDRDNAMRDAQRAVEDTLLPENADSSVAVAREEIRLLQSGLADYQEILNNEGIITAKTGGMITGIYVEAGSRIPDSAAMMLTDDSIPCQFKVVFDKEQRKYIGYGDEATVKLDGSGKEIEVTIDYISESQTMPGSFETLISLSEDGNSGNGKWVPGLSGVLKRAERGEKHRYCVSPLAVVTTSDKRTFVYILKQREGILGEEYYVEEVNVKVLDKNESWVAIETEALDEDSRIIVSSDKEIGKGDVVRWIA
ncbi:MAG: HlyD family secretion protein [Lachnospiraceae bacterium]|nr:HlyD family secretion protein [Lachnospiraceae bacterium]